MRKTLLFSVLFLSAHSAAAAPTHLKCTTLVGESRPISVVVYEDKGEVVFQVGELGPVIRKPALIGADKISWRLSVPSKNKWAVFELERTGVLGIRNSEGSSSVQLCDPVEPPVDRKF